MLGFKYQDVVREFPEKNPNFLSNLLADMVDKGMLFKISRNNYHIIPLHADPESYTPDRNQMAKYIMQNKGYYIGYASALQIHGLTSIEGGEKPGVNLATGPDDTNHAGKKNHRIKKYIVTEKPMTPVIRSFREYSYQFVHHNDTRFFGFSSRWINPQEKVEVSDLEKTIVDIATKPQFCGGIVGLGKVLIQAKDRTNHDKLFYYFARNRNKSAKRRFLFLIDLLGLEWTPEHERLMEELGSGFSLLDPLAPDLGKKRKQFGLKINVDPSFIKNEVFNP